MTLPIELSLHHYTHTHTPSPFCLTPSLSLCRHARGALSLKLTDIPQSTARKRSLDTVSRRIHDEPPARRTAALAVRTAAITERTARGAIVDRTKPVSYFVRNQGPFGLQGGRYAGAGYVRGALALG